MHLPFEKTAYGCVFCITGKEEAVANRIQRQCPQIRALTARQEKYHSCQGKKDRVEAILLPGYVFIEAPMDFDMGLLPREDVHACLRTDGAWQLAGEDRRYVEMIFRYNGLLGFSKAYREGDRIHILSGPLKDMEAWIVRIDRRGRSGQVKMDIGGRSVLVWLGFELVEDVDA